MAITKRLVEYPPQPFYLLRPELVAALERARSIRNRLARYDRGPILLYTGDKRGLLSAWRSYAQQLMLWLAGLKPGNPYASNPNTGVRAHMRGAGADVRDQDSITQRALAAAGLIRDPFEAWHWNLPNVLSYPIILTKASAMPAPAPTLTVKDDDMRNIYINDKSVKADDRDVKIGATTWIHGAAGQYEVDKKLYGTRISVSKKQAQKALADVNRQRAQVGLPPIVDPIIA